ncbi:Txe/YoeB family addiction module toxin [Capnocytophaga ochracea]|jgi:addiction module toxin, txe/yoeB family|uniref:Txe/YoeB family addiction module toxin n=1 Tax=Capnocytophaga ochracea TaxID=1018 RepID=UPI0006607A65|nr:Txe/YoeB family addiction module toxin [Capnocytophaga ochracea]
MEGEYALILSDLFKEQYTAFSSSGKIKIIEKIDKLIFEIIKEPRKGTGKPERLKDVSKIAPELDPQFIHIWSRRITDEHRLTYRIYDEEKIVFVMLCKGHYVDFKKFYGFDFLLEN